MKGMRGALRLVRHAIGGLAGAAREINYANRRMTVLRMAPDRFLGEPGRPPDTYSEFLARTSGPLTCEPSARARLRGRPVG